MKYFAILRDSFRETADSKVLYVLFGLSAPAIVLVGSMSFKPKSADATFQQLSNRWATRILNNPTNDINDPMRFMMNRTRIPYIQMLGVELLQGEANSPQSEYLLTLHHQPGDKDGPFGRADARQMQAPDGVAVPDRTPPVDGAKDNQGKAANGKKAGPDDAKAQQTAAAKLAADKAAFIDKCCATAENDVRELFHKVEDLELIKVVKIEAVRPTLEFLAHVQQESWPLMRPSINVKATVKGTPRTFRIWATETSFLFGAWEPKGTSMLGPGVFQLADWVMYLGGLAAVLLGVIITSSFVPNMLHKGTVDLLLVKPIHRSALMFYKYVGGLMFIFLITSFSVAGIYLVIGLRTGMWGYQTLLLIPSITFFFAILYAISTFVGVMTRSTIACILLTITAWVGSFLIGWFHQTIQAEIMVEKKVNAAEAERTEGSGVAKTFAILHMLTPRTKDLDRLNTLILYSSFVTGDLGELDRFNEGGTVWWESLLVAGVWIIVFLGGACVWFSFKDY